MSIKIPKDQRKERIVFERVTTLLPPSAKGARLCLVAQRSWLPARNVGLVKIRVVGIDDRQAAGAHKGDKQCIAKVHIGGKLIQTESGQDGMAILYTEVGQTDQGSEEGGHLMAWKVVLALGRENKDGIRNDSNSPARWRTIGPAGLRGGSRLKAI